MAITAFTEENNGVSPLTQKLRDQISSAGPIPFREFMTTALYDEAYGYYAGNQQRVGKNGDFITSVSVGRCFGLILAHRLERYWHKIGRPKVFHMIEPGAHDAALSLDILSEIHDAMPDFYRVIHYHLVETTDKLRTAQAETLAPLHAEKFSIHHSLKKINGVTGAIISNELIDAFPVDLIRFFQGEWQLLSVVLDADAQFKLSPTPLSVEDSHLIAFCEKLSEKADFPEGYTTEYQPSLKSYTAEASAALAKGLFITVDYGHHAEDYYHPDRSEGTLQTYHDHQKSDNPLAAPGEIDITCHVDFTRLCHEAEAAGFQLNSLGTQASYLTRHAKDWLLSLEKVLTPETPALLRQFQTLTHPSMLGTRFMVLEMEKRLTDSPR